MVEGGKKIRFMQEEDRKSFMSLSLLAVGWSTLGLLCGVSLCSCSISYRLL